MRITFSNYKQLSCAISLQDLAHDTLRAVKAKFSPHTPPLGEMPIEILKVNNPLPPRVVSPIPPDKYVIHLNAESNLPQQFVYQFAHELAHVWFDPRISNQVLEALCVQLSLEVVDGMKSIWIKSNNHQVTQWALK